MSVNALHRPFWNFPLTRWLFRARRAQIEGPGDRSPPGATGVAVPGFGDRQFRPLSSLRSEKLSSYTLDQRPDSAASSPNLGRPTVATPLRDGEDKLARLRDVFTPTQPKLFGPLFIGRERYLSRLILAVEEERTHIVLFGERGRGKTSLANAFAHIANEAGYLVVRQSCSATTTFEELFRSIFGQIPPHLVTPSLRSVAPTPVDLLPEGSFDASDLIEALQKITARRAIFVIDEIDRIRSESVRTAISETIKELSDARLPVTLLMVGVAENLDSLLGQHPSIERSIVGLHLLRMKPEEIRRVLEAGAIAAGLRFDDAVISAIQSCTRGMPYYAHLLGLFAGVVAMKRTATRVEYSDFCTAIDYVLMKQEQEVGAAYKTACASGVENLLIHAALAEPDEHDCFDAEAVLNAYEKHAGRFAASSPLEVEKELDSIAALRPPILLSYGASPMKRYGFAQQTMAHYLLLRRIASGEQIARVGVHA